MKCLKKGVSIAANNLRFSSRHFGTSKGCLAQNPAYQVFDRNVKRIQKSRAANDVHQSRDVDYLREEVALRMVERLAFISRRFDKILDLGSGSGSLEKVVCLPSTPDGQLVRSRLGKIIMLDSSEPLLYRDFDAGRYEFNELLDLQRIVGDEEQLPIGEPFTPGTFNAVISNMSMHWINDLPGTLANINQLLVPDGMFMASMLGGDTLFELRTSLQLAELERLGGISPRLSPLADVKDIGGLLQRAQFKMLTVDVDDIIVSYPDIYSLMTDLQAMGESNAVLSRQPFISRDVLLAAEAIYKALHGNEDGTIPATFRVINMIGWKASESQPQPLKRGSGQVSLKDALPKFDNNDPEKRLQQQRQPDLVKDGTVKA